MGPDWDWGTFFYFTILLHKLLKTTKMEAIILTKDQYNDLMAKLDAIQSQLNTKPDPKKETFLDNQEFIMLMKISKRTAQTWRDEGKISFSQVGSKIYYKLSDVEKLLQEHYNKSFKGKWYEPVQRNLRSLWL